MCHKDAWSVWLLGTEWEHNELLPDLLLAWWSSCSRQIPQRGLQTWFICAGTYVEPRSKSHSRWCDPETGIGVSSRRWLPSLALKHIFYIERQKNRDAPATFWNILMIWMLSSTLARMRFSCCCETTLIEPVPTGLTHPNLINYICNRFKLEPKHTLY